MITREKILAIGVTSRISYEYTWTEAEDTLDELGVEDAAERIEWYNVMTLDTDDIVLLANVRFQVITCDRCGAQIPIGDPENWGDFQGVLQGDYGPVVINGREIIVCDECYGYLTNLGR